MHLTQVTVTLAMLHLLTGSDCGENDTPHVPRLHRDCRALTLDSRNRSRQSP